MRRLIFLLAVLVTIIPLIGYAGGGGAIVTNKSITVGGVEFIWIPAGEFMMGSMDSEGNDNEHPQHKVKIKEFWMAKYLLTQKVYQDVMGNNPSKFKGVDNPVENVSWNNANEFCNKFKEKYGVEIRLPTEAEWEYACRAMTTTKYYWGDVFNGDYCWYDGDSSNTTHPFGQKRPNKWGLYGMAGNVWEWCSDWYDSRYYSVSPADDPHGPASGTNKVMRGGSFYNLVADLRSAFRFSFSPSYFNLNVGFRPTKTP